jgi:Fe-S oxidoreductase
VINVFELMKEYIEQGKVKIDRSKFEGKRLRCMIPATTAQGRKGLWHGYYEEFRWIVDQICTDWVDTYPSKENNYCCGAGGGAWAMPYSEERIYYGRKKAQQIKEAGAEIVVAPCHNCRDQIMKSLNKEYDLGIETLYLWELLAESIIVEPWPDELAEKGRAEAKEQWDRLGVEDVEY